MTALAGVELESLVSEPDALTTRPPQYFCPYSKTSADCYSKTALSLVQIFFSGVRCFVSYQMLSRHWKHLLQC